MPEHIDLINAIRQATQAMETATHHIAVLEAEIERLRLERADRKSTRLNSSHVSESRMPSSA